jgi:hypothetical protein
VFRVLINLSVGQSVLIGDTNMIVGATTFFKPARAWLDSLWFTLPALIDGAPVPLDLLTLAGITEYQLDAAPPPSDAALGIHVTASPIADPYAPIAPTYDAHYRHSGITHGANEPIVADSALVLNGAAILNGG